MAFILCIGGGRIDSGGGNNGGGGTTPTYSKGFRDLTVIPDKYNTGCDESLITTTIASGDESTAKSLIGVGIKDNGYIDFQYQNPNMPERKEVSNVDFQRSLNCNNYSGYDNVRTLVFNNCKFTNFTAPMSEDSKVRIIFNNCTIKFFQGGWTTLNNCYIGSVGDNGDAVMANYEVYINDSYLYKFLTVDENYTGSPGHVDAIQVINSRNTYPVGNVHLSNTRIEIPPMNIQSSGYVNSCIITSPNAQNLENLTIDNCVFNGGGYMFYVGINSETNYVEADISNTIVGASRRYGVRYTYANENPNDDITYTNVVDTPTLYVSSVWKDNNTIHCIVTNDTAEERTLVIHTAEGDVTYTIPGVPAFADTANMTYADFPFDLDKTVTSNSNYVVCFDNTDGNMTQIRYETFE